MDAVREVVVASANALRKREGKRVRLPLAAAHRRASPDAAALAQFEDILRDELNVKAVELVDLQDEHRRRVRHHAPALA